MEILRQDLRQAFRALVQAPMFAIIAVGALALGIGANTAAFSVVHGMLLRGLPYNDPERLVTFGCSIPDSRDIRESSRAFDGIAVWASNQYTIPARDNAEQVMGATVSPEFFPLLGEASFGRTFRPEEERSLVAVISHDFWVSHYSSDPGVLGKTVKLTNKLYTIIGVMPREFTYPGDQFKVWVPLGSALGDAPEQMENRQLRIFRIVAHLASGVSMGNAQAELDNISSRLAQQYPATNAGVRYRITSLRDTIVGPIRAALLALFGTVALVLVIACANVANLLLARTTSRTREISVRAALGAGRGRIIRLLLTESLLLSALGSSAGLLIAYVSLRMLRTFNPGNLPRIESVEINSPVLLFTVGVGFVTALIFGLMPAWQASSVNLLSGLKDAGRGSSSGTVARKLRDVVVVSEIALSLVVLIAAGLLVKSFERLTHVPTGFQSEHLLSVPVLLANVQKPQRAEVLAEVIGRVSALPGVTAVGGGSGLPPVSPQRGTRFEVEGADNSNADERFAYFLIITPDYFHALGTKLLEGRFFTERDNAGSANAVIINRELAQRLFSNQDAIGRRIRIVNPDQSRDWRTVVGIVEKIRYSGLADASDAQIYTPFAQTPFLWTYLMVRTGPAAPGVGAIRSAIESANAALNAGQVQSMDELVFASVAQPRFQTVLLTCFAGIALALAIIGIYGVISYSVAQRTHEIGVRMAIGAQRFHVLRMVLAQGSRLAAFGIAAGVLLALAASRFLASMLFEVKTTDPKTFIAVSVLLGGVAVAASYIPARRAARVDPVVALRYE